MCAGSSRDRQDRHVGHHRVPPGEAEQRAGLGVRPFQHRCGPADREDPQDGTQGEAWVCVEQCRPLRSAKEKFLEMEQLNRAGNSRD